MGLADPRSILLCLPALLPGDFDGVVPLPDPSVGKVIRSSDSYWIRRTDPFGVAPLPQEQNPPNLLQISYGLWRPEDPGAGQPFDRFEGLYRSDGDHLRLDLVFACIVSPLGPIGVEWEGHTYGPSPLHGFVEIDIDGDPETGGVGRDQDIVFYYGSNVARFGGLPSDPRYAGRIATHLELPDADPQSEPRIDRSGCELVLSFESISNSGFGLPSIVQERPPTPGTPPGTFGPGARWLVNAPGVLSPATGYDPFTGYVAAWLPDAVLAFDHDLEANVTVVTLVYPMTHAGWARANGGDPAQPPALDFGLDAAFSIEEVLFGLIRSAEFGINSGDPFWELIAPWAGRDPGDYLSPAAWHMTGIFGTVPVHPPHPTHGVYVLTDILPEVVAGDVDGNGVFDALDRAVVAQFIADHDGVPPFDSGPAGDGRIDMADFGPLFVLYDLDYDGDVDADDVGFGGCPVGQFQRCMTEFSDCNENSIDDACELGSAPLAGDFDGDGDVDLEDFAAFFDCLGAPGLPHPTGCEPGDFDGDGDVDLDDFTALQLALGTSASLPGDCNHNGVLDACDIAKGTSADCNGDGIPDECQAEFDCNGNGVLELCEGSGDFDGDGWITTEDLVALLECLGGPGAPYPGGIGCIVFDVDHDLDVDLEDFVLLSALLGSPAPLPGKPVPCEETPLATLLLSSTVGDAEAFIEPNPHFEALTKLSLEATELRYALGTGLTLHLASEGASGRAFLGWEIDGKLHGDKSLILELEQPATVAVARFAP